MQEAKSSSAFDALRSVLQRRQIAWAEDGYSQEILLLAFALASLFTLCSLASFSPFDPSIYNYSFPPRHPQNVGGLIGSYLAGWMIYSFGAIAYLLPLPWLVMSTSAALGQKEAFHRTRLCGWLLLSLVCSMAAANWGPELSLDGVKYLPAGAFGFYSHRAVVYLIGPAGLTILLATSLLQAIILIRRQALVRPVLLKARQGLAKTLAEREKSRPKIATAEVQASLWRKLFIRSKKAPAIAVSSPKTSSDIAPEPSLQPDEPTVLNAMPSCSPLAKVELRPAVHVSQAQEHAVAKLEHLERIGDPSYEPPPAALFKTSSFNAVIPDDQRREFEQTAEALVKGFSEFGIGGEIIAIQPGPVVTVYEFQPHAGTKLAKVTGLLDDIALTLRVDSIFIHPVSGKRALGVQVPNKKRETVFLGDIVHNSVFQQARSPLTIALGRALNGEPICCDLASMPHLLTAGQTGAGKSVAINSLLCSIILKASPDEVKMILVDPKILELKIYEGIPHLLMPVITEPLKASLALKWACQEMDRRYQLMETASVRHITGFNQFWEGASAEQKISIRERLPSIEINKLPFIIIVIDELADLMLTASKDVEGSIQRLAQKARACGIHLVLATQRPSVDVITGVIKANLPCRIAFKVFSRIDSRTILDSMGAERLLGKGDMLFLRPGSSRLERIQGAFLSDEEVVTMVDHLKKTTSAVYDASAMEWIDQEYERQAHPGIGDSMGEEPGSADPKWNEAIAIAQRQGAISASYLQRMLKIGYNRAARIVEGMEAQGLVAKADGSKPRAWIGMNHG